MSNTRPTILVDMDGPLADFDKAFFSLCNSKGWTLDCTPFTQTHRFATDHIPHSIARSLARRFVETSGWFERLPMTGGAKGYMDQLAERAEVWIVSKPLEANPTCRDEKGAWLRRNFGPEWERRLILAADKSMVRGDVLLDDAPHPDLYERATWKPVIFKTPWNGEGSKWAGLPHWTWGNPFDLLLNPSSGDTDPTNEKVD